MTALDTATGARRWTATVPGAGELAVADDRLWVPQGGVDCHIVALDRATGAVTGSHSFGGPAMTGPGESSVCFAGDVVATGSKVVTTWTYVGSAPAPPGVCPGNVLSEVGAGLGAADIADGGADWTVGGLEPTCATPPIVPPPTDAALSSDGTIVFAPGPGGAAGYRVDCPPTCPRDRALTLSPAVVPVVIPLANGTEAVVVREDGHVAVVDAHSGGEHWSGVLGAAAATPAAVTDATIFATSTSGTLSAFPVVACGAATCPATWTATLPAGATGHPSIVADVLYVGTADGTLTALPARGCRAATCSALFTANVPGAVAGAPVADDGLLFVGSTAGSVTAFRPAA